MQQSFGNETHGGLRIELASCESLSSWRDLLIGLRGRLLHGVEFVVSDDHADFGKPFNKCCRKRFGSAAMFIFCGTLWIICRAKPMMIACRNCAGSTIGVMLRKHGRSGGLADQVGQAYAKLWGWVEENIEETLSFYRLPRQHHKNMKSTNMLDGSWKRSNCVP